MFSSSETVSGPTVEEVLERIAASPAGPQVGAFFDFTGTVIEPMSARRLRARVERFGEDSVKADLLDGLRTAKTEEMLHHAVEVVYPRWAGKAPAELEEVAGSLFERVVAGQLYTEVWQLVRAHQAREHTVVVVTSGPRFVAEQAAAALDVPCVLATELEVEDGVLTGRVVGAPLWRRAKAQAVKAFAAEHGVELSESFGYSDGGEDVELLSTVGVPFAANPDAVLARVAERRRWPQLRLKPRGASRAEVARTAVSYGGIVSAVGVGLARGAVKRDLRAGIDTAIGQTADVALRMQGVTVNVRGEENVWEHRPCVFIINHQSGLDALIVAKVLRGGLTGIVKKEVAQHKFFGPLLTLAGAVFIDRGDSAGARAALEPVVEAIKGGLSLVIAPEGTRSLTPSVLPFKKGAFHIAMQAGVPIVPVIIRNAGELMWKFANTVRSGTVEVIVAAPIDVSGWTVEELDERVEQVRQLYVRILDNWPSE